MADEEDLFDVSMDELVGGPVGGFQGGLRRGWGRRRRPGYGPAEGGGGLTDLPLEVGGNLEAAHLPVGGLTAI